MREISIRSLNYLGQLWIKPIAALGSYLLFCKESIHRIFSPRLDLILLLRQMEFVGNKSFGVIVLAGIMIGGIFGFQLGEIFKIFGATSMMGAAAAYTLSREMAPVVGAMLVAGRAGSAMAAELAIMRVNEQIDAMRVMAVNPHNYLVSPRIVATVLMLPLLFSIFVISGVITSFFVGVFFYDVDVGMFLDRITWIVETKDIMQGLQKTLVFGFIVASIGCYRGFHARGGAKGVGNATTSSVVISFVLILIVDFVMTYVQYKLE